MLVCLEEHRHEGEFSDRCRGPLEGKMERESADYELNAGLRCAGCCAVLCCAMLHCAVLGCQGSSDMCCAALGPWHCTRQQFHQTPACPTCPAAAFPLNCSEYCEEDIDELCEEEKERIQLAEGYGADSQVITCLEVGVAGIWLGAGLGTQCYVCLFVCGFSFCF